MVVVVVVVVMVVVEKEEEEEEEESPEDTRFTEVDVVQHFNWYSDMYLRATLQEKEDKERYVGVFVLNIHAFDINCPYIKH